MHTNQHVLTSFYEYQTIYVLDCLKTVLTNALLTYKKKEALFNSIKVLLLFY
jgi:adenosyl cobinamide kinase/adenosyl cobinamide phosphate guanylyltransferase